MRSHKQTCLAFHFHTCLHVLGKTQLAGHIGEILAVYLSTNYTTRTKCCKIKHLLALYTTRKKCCKIKHFLALYTTCKKCCKIKRFLALYTTFNEYTAPAMFIAPVPTPTLQFYCFCTCWSLAFKRHWFESSSYFEPVREQVRFGVRWNGGSLFESSSGFGI